MGPRFWDLGKHHANVQDYAVRDQGDERGETGFVFPIGWGESAEVLELAETAFDADAQDHCCVR